MIVILDYGMGNVGSIQNMLKKIGERNVVISREPDVVTKADKMILPGVGSFDMGMSKLGEFKLLDLIHKHVNSHKPLLGICLGMQLLGFGSEEGQHSGLGLVPFHCTRFDLSGSDSESNAQGLKIPHMGWDRVLVTQISPLTENLDDKQRYYFVHSYHAVCGSADNILMTCDYGYPFPAALYSGNVWGVQFHPEKSHLYGMRLLENFIQRC